MTKTPVTIAQIDELTACLPTVFGEGAEPFVTEPNWEASDVIVLSGPKYSDAVRDLFFIAASEQWQDPDYMSKGAEMMLANPETIANASIDDIRTMLTHCVRGERFASGYRERVLKGGQILQILEKLVVLRDKMANDGR
jgi:hypothetical protein